MTNKIETTLAQLGITLPDAPGPAANYVPFVHVGDWYTFLAKLARTQKVLSLAN